MLRKARRRFGITAPRLSVRPHVAWYLRWGMTIPFLLAVLALIWFAYDSGLELAGFDRGKTRKELEDLRSTVSRLSAENADLNRKVAQFEQQLQMDKGQSAETASQLKNLSDENLKLQEDLNFFRDLTAANGREGELAIHRLTLERDRMPGEYRVRMLLVQSGVRVKEFSGSYQLVATVLQGGKKTTRIFPSVNSGNEPFQLNFKYYVRLEKSFSLPQDVQLLNVEVRLYEHGVTEPRVRQSVNLG